MLEMHTDKGWKKRYGVSEFAPEESGAGGSRGRTVRGLDVRRGAGSCWPAAVGKR